MKIRKIAYILLTISLIMITSGSVSSFFIGLRADRIQTNERMVNVSDIFEAFNTNISLFEETRDKLYETTLSNIFYDSMYQTDAQTKNSLSNYENMVDEIYKKVKKLDNLCTDVYYPDGSVNNKCMNYKAIYEQVNNYFVTDIKLYNSNIEKFNLYQASQGSTISLKKYKSKKTYIDYNDDKNFEGKEE